MLHRFLALLISLIGLALVAWAYLDPRFRGSEGILTGSFCLPFSISVALLVLAWSVSKEQWRKFGLWFALALIGQAVALQMIDAGPLIHYQHYRPFQDIHSFLLVLFLIQICVVGIGLRSRWAFISAWIRRHVRTWQLVVIGVVFIASSAPPSREVGFYVTELFFAALVQAVSLGNIVLMVWALPPETLSNWQRRFNRWFGHPEDQDRALRLEGRRSRMDDHESKIQTLKPVLSSSTPLRINSDEESKIQNLESKTCREETRRIQNPSVDRFAFLAAIWVTVLAAILSIFVYERHPHVADEVVYLNHARYLANGMLTMPAPLVPEAFELYLMEVEKGRWYASPPVGWPVMLAVGVLFGAPWLTNPLLAGINTLLAYLLLAELYGRRTARLGVFLLCISPWHLFMAMNFMTHTFTLTCALVAALAFIWARRNRNMWWGGVSGISTGIMGLIRPLEGLLWAGLLGLWSVGIGGRRLTIASMLAFSLGFGAIGALSLLYNKALTGKPTVFPIKAYTDKHFGVNSNAFGFGPDRGMGWALDPYPGHGLRDAVVNANLNMFSLNIELFGWSTGSLIIGAAMLFSGTMRRHDYLMVAVIAADFGAHIFFWYSGGPDFGARYWYLMLIPLVALTVRGIEFIGNLFASASTTGSSEGRVLIAALSLSLLAVVNYLPWRAVDKYYRYLGMRPDIRHLAEEYRFGKSLVLVRGNAQPDYASAFPYNPTNFSADVPIYAWDRGPELQAKLVAAYPNRPVWIVNGPSITGNGYKVIAGPPPKDHAVLQVNDGH